MKFEQAYGQAKLGKGIRHPGMGEGWKLLFHTKTDSLYCINPITNSDHLFTATPGEFKREDWEVIE